MTADKDVFTNIYSNGVWSQGSGSGSHPDNTRSYREFLQDFISTRGVVSVVDFGCGDWQSSQYMDWGGVSYLGVDVVDSLIKENSRKYQTDSVRFERVNSIDDPLPSADLLIVKDVFQHWPNEHIQKFRRHLDRFRFALITNTRESRGVETDRPIGAALNSDIDVGGLRPVNLSLPPFKWEVEEVFSHTSRRQSIRAHELKSTVLYISKF